MNLNPKIATVGMFDGVHRGHRFLFEQLKAEGEKRGMETLVISFLTHPLAVVAPKRVPPMLSSIDEREREILLTGINSCVFLDFNAEMQQLTAREFMAKIYKEYAVRTLILGFNNRFGSDRLTDISDYQKIGEEVGIEVLQAQEYPEASSSIVRRLILDKRIEEAAAVLGRFYSVIGRVVRGKQLGRTIGFPTANIEPLDKKKLIPPVGVYATRVTMCDGVSYVAMVNIGRRPTVDREMAPISIEANIFGFDGDIYDKELTIEFVSFIRDEQKFNSLDELRTQISLDKSTTQRICSGLV